jgi:hypothetical protein
MAKYNYIKTHGGVLIPADEDEAERMTSFKNGEMYQVEIKRSRNPHFHRKMFSFFSFCFKYWCADNSKYELMTNEAQKKEHRNNLTIIAGYYDTVVDVRGETHYRAQSLSYENMDQEEFEQCCSAMINAALRTIFKNVTDKNILNELYSYF